MKIMTTDEIKDLDGIALDAACARALGWKVFASHSVLEQTSYTMLVKGTNSPIYLVYDCEHPNDVNITVPLVMYEKSVDKGWWTPHYDISTAYELIKKTGKPFLWTLSCDYSGSSVWHKVEARWNWNNAVTGEGPTLPIAICRAFLLAMNVREKDNQRIKK